MAFGLAEQLKDFAQYHGHEELSFTVSKVNDILHEFNSSFELSLYQKTITDVFFLLEVHIFTFKAFPTSVATGFSALNSNW